MFLSQPRPRESLQPFSFSTGFLSIFLFIVVLAVVSLLIRTELQLAEDTTAWQISTVGLVLSSITATT